MQSRTTTLGNTTWIASGKTLSLSTQAKICPSDLVLGDELGLEAAAAVAWHFSVLA